MSNKVTGVLNVNYKAGKVGSITANLSGVVFQDEHSDTWIAHCKELDLSSCADSHEAALEHIKEAIDLFFESCIGRGVLEKVLSQLGWICIRDSRRVACKPGVIPQGVLPAFMLDKMRRDGKEWSSRVSFGHS